MKTCCKCRETKPVTEFFNDSSRTDGLQYKCKTCESARQAAYYAADKEKFRSRQREQRAANPEKKKSSNAKYNAAHTEARLIIGHNRRARETESGGKLSTDIAERRYTLQGGKCACGCKQPLGTDYHRDHIMPLALGGSNTDDNIQLLRPACNLNKSAKHPVDFMQQRGFLI